LAALLVARYGEQVEGRAGRIRQRDGEYLPNDLRGIIQLLVCRLAEGSGGVSAG
jgi:hypothetical protein